VLQGDCMTGVWAQRARRQIGAVPEGAWERAVAAVRATSAEAARDARLDIAAPEARGAAFALGYEAGQLRDCLSTGLAGVLR
jgi:predicted metalloprotease